MDALPKIAWVALPLAAAGGWWLWLALRGRAPGRLALNVASSLLLLVYLGATAGLGIFWVAQQQLPVFDWHYLFGYGTLLLLVLHLVMNGPIVWRFLVQRARKARAAAPPAGAAPAGPGPAARPGAPRDAAARSASVDLADAGRRTGLRAAGLLGALAAAGGALWWAWRSGHRAGVQAGRDAALAEQALASSRTPVPTPAAPAAGVDRARADAAARVLVERFHALSSSVRRGGVPGAPPVSWGDPPPPFKTLAGDRLALPAPLRAPRPAGGRPAAPALALSTALWHTSAVTEQRGGLALRAAPSSGALWATELYLLSPGFADLPPGAWHHDARANALVRVAEPAAVAALVLPPGTLAVVATAIFRRTGYKYRDRTWRYILADLGHKLENLRIGALASGWALALSPGFDEAGVAGVLGLDEGEEGVLAWAALAPPPAGPAGAVASSLRPAAAPNPDPRLGITAAIHHASRWQPGRGAAAGERADRVPLPPGNPLALIARRRSRRRFRAEALPREVLLGMLRGLHVERPLLLPGLRVHLVAHAVDGLEPGAWRWEPGADAGRGALRAVRAEADAAALRRASRAAALDQDVIGDAAAVLVLGVPKAAWADAPEGPARGYRHALIEAGLVGERWYLQAEAAGLGACGVGAFFDDEAAALVGADLRDEWMLHFAAVGRAV